MKKLLLMVPALWQGGFERVCVETAKILTKKASDRIQVEICIFTDQEINYDISKLAVTNLNIPAVPSRAGKVLNVFKRVNRVKKLKKRGRYDYCYSFGSTANLVNGLTKGQGKTFLGLRSQIDLDNEKQIRFFASHCDQLICCSGEIEKELHERFHITNTVRLYNPIDDKGIREKAKEKIDDFPFKEEGLKVICTLGREDDYKGYWHLIKAFSLVHEKDPSVRLLIVGSGTFEPYKKLAADLGVGDLVAFPGVRKNPFPYLAPCSLYVTSSNIEGFPNALLEAMALGLPVISTDCRTGPAEILCEKEETGHVSAILDADYGVLVPDMDNKPDFTTTITKDDETLAAAMEGMLSSREKLAHYGEQSLYRVQAYSPESYCRNLLSILGVN